MADTRRDSDDNVAQWQEADSATFIDMGRAMIPRRDEMERTILALIPARQDEAFTFVDIAAGDGWLSRAILDRFPRAHAIVTDGSPTMLEQAAQSLAAYQNRFALRQFRLEDDHWPDSTIGQVRCFVSSLAIHHLDDDGKRRLFARLHEQLDPGGAVLIADLLQPANERALALAADEWSNAVRRQALEQSGSLDGFDLFTNDHWNIFDFPDPMDTPSRLSDQLDWFREAGFVAADAFWLYAGHALYGAFRRD